MSASRNARYWSRCKRAVDVGAFGFSCLLSLFSGLAVERFLVVPRGPEYHARVDRVGIDDRRDRVVERQRVGPEPRPERRRQRVGRERAGGHDAWGRNRRHLAAFDGDERVGLDARRDRRRELFPVDREGGPGGDARPVRRGQHHAAERPHLLFQEPVSVGDLGALEGVGADQLREVAGPVGRRLPHGPHLVEDDRHPALRELPRRFAPGQPPAGNVDRHARKIVPRGCPDLSPGHPEPVPSIGYLFGPMAVSQEPKDLGFGSVVAAQSRVRLMNRDGSFNVQRGGRLAAIIGNPYHSLLTMGWPAFLGVLAAVYILANLLFAALFMACGPRGAG